MFETLESLMSPLLGTAGEEDIDVEPKTLGYRLNPCVQGKEDPFLQALSSLKDTPVSINLKEIVVCACSCKGGVVVGMKDGSLSFVPFDTEESKFLGKHLESVCTLTSSREKVASGSTDGAVKVWDLIVNREIATFQGHKESVTCLAITPNGKYVISGSRDQTVKLWSLKQKQEVKVVASPVTCTSLTPRGHVVSGSWDKAIRVLATEENKNEFKMLQGHERSVTCLVVSSDSKYVVSGSDDAVVKVWNIGEVWEVANFLGHSGAVTCVVITRDGKLVFSGSKDFSVKMWSVEEKKELANLQQHSGVVTCLSLLADEKHVISGSCDKSVKIWDIVKKTVLVLNHTGMLSCLLVLPDGHHFATGTDDMKVTVWKVGEDREVATLQLDKPVTHLSIMATSKLVISGKSDQVVTIWKLSEVKETVMFRGHTGSITGLTMLQDKKSVASGSTDHTVKIWTIEKAGVFRTLQEKASPAPALSKVISKAQNRLSRSMTPQILAREDRQELEHKITCSAILPDGERLLFGASDGAVKLWSLQSWVEIATVHIHPEAVSFISLCADEKQAVTGCTDHKIRIVDFDKNAEVATLTGHQQRVTCARMLPDEKFLISGSKDKTVKVWRFVNAADKYMKVKKSWSKDEKNEVATLKGHTEKVTCVAYMEKEKYVVSGSKDKTIKVWSLEELKEVATLQGHTERVTCVSVSTDGKYIFSGAKDKIVRIWSMMEAKEVALVQEHTDRVTCLSVSLDGNYLISGSKDKTLCRTDLRLKIPEYRSNYFKSGQVLYSTSYYFCEKYWDNLARGVRINLSVAALPVLPFYFNSLHICAHYNQSDQLQYYLEHEVPIAKSAFGSPLKIALKRNTIKCINVMLKHLTETCRTTSGFFAVQEITDDFPTLLQCGSPYLVQFFTMLLHQQPQSELPEFIKPLNSLPVTLFRQKRYIVLQDFAQKKSIE